MSNRFPPLAAQSPVLIAAVRCASAPKLPHWLRSFPIGELLILAAAGMLFALG